MKVPIGRIIRYVEWVIGKVFGDGLEHLKLECTRWINVKYMKNSLYWREKYVDIPHNRKTIQIINSNFSQCTGIFY